ncbi:MAG: hypothetical protein WCH39_09390 [Schlesneria sp.]
MPGLRIDLAVEEFFDVARDEISASTLSADSKQQLKEIVDSHLH